MMIIYRLSWYVIMMITINYHGDMGILVITFLLV